MYTITHAPNINTHTYKYIRSYIPHATSQQTLNTSVEDERSQYGQTNGTSTNETTDRSTPTTTRSRTNQQNASRHSAAYVRNYRLSRYRNALKGALPFRLNTIR